MRLLLVQDCASANDRLAVTLRQHSYAVDVTNGMRDALYQADINSYGIILSEDDLPDATGRMLCQRMRALGVQAPILILGTDETVNARIAALESGADDCLAQQFDVRELLAKLRALARRGPLRMADRLQVADLEIDTLGRTVSRCGRQIELTAKEYVILEFMARHQNELITRGQLADHAWDRNFDPFSNVIDVYMLRLRRKIDAPYLDKLLRTMRGSGYMLSSRLPASSAKWPSVGRLGFFPSASASGFNGSVSSIAGRQ